MFYFRISLATVLLVFLVISISLASPITWKIEGTVSDVPNVLDSQFDIGGAFTGLFSFDTDSTDSQPNTSYRGRYEGAASMSGSVDGYGAFTDNMYVNIINNLDRDGSDSLTSSYGTYTNSTGNRIGNYWFLGFSFYLKDNEGAMLSSISLPRLPPDLSLADACSVKLRFGKPYPHVGSWLGASLEISQLTITRVAPVPEPATFLLLSSGLAGLAFYKRKRK